MNTESVVKILTDVGAVIVDSHLVYTSGRHGSAYINKDALYVHPKTTSILCEEIAAQYDPHQVDIVAGPTVGGVILSQWVAYHLNMRRSHGETLSLYAEEDVLSGEKKRIFKRGYDLYIPRKNVLVVEDTLNTGGSARKVIEAVRALGGNVLGLGVICNRGNVGPEDVGGVPIKALADVAMDSWEAESCPLCQKNVPINMSIGKGKEFLARRKAAQAN